MKYFLILSFCFIFLQSNAQNSISKNETDTVSKTGLATYYHGKFHGRRTSSGARYNKQLLTAAHRSLPFGTKIKVTNPLNGKSVIVKINDRGPFIKKYLIDISEKAARAIGIFHKGTAKVTLNYTLE